MDRKYFVEDEHLLFDKIEDEEQNKHYSALLYGMYDSGTYFFSQILERKIPYKNIFFFDNDVNKNPYFFHFGGASCKQRDSSNGWFDEVYETQRNYVENDSFLQELFKANNFNFKEES